MPRPSLADAGRLPRMLVAAVVTGVLTGLVVAAFEQITTEILRLEEILDETGG